MMALKWIRIYQTDIIHNFYKIKYFVKEYIFINHAKKSKNIKTDTKSLKCNNKRMSCVPGVKLIEKIIDILLEQP